MKPVVVAVAAALFATAAGAVPAPAPAPPPTTASDTRQLGEAVLTLLTKRHAIERTLLRCGEIDPVNVQRGRDALDNWDLRNAPYAALLPGLLEEVHQTLLANGGEAVWQAYRHQALPQRMEPLVSELAANLESLAVEDRPYFCTELIAAMASGRLDFHQEAPINTYLDERLRHPPKAPPAAPTAPPPPAPPVPPAPPAKSD